MLALVVRSHPQRIKYELFFFQGEEVGVVISGKVFDIGAENPQHHYEYAAQGRGEGATLARDHREAFERIAALLSSRTTGEDDYSKQLAVVAHWLPHGGETFSEPTIVDQSMLEALEAVFPYAPCEVPVAVEGIRVSMSVFSTAPHVAVFDTAFFQSMEKDAFLYALPLEVYEEQRLRRYGFHGISHQNAILAGCAALGKGPEGIRICSVYLGEESSAVAFDNGRCVESATGLTANAGLLGASTSGDIDPAALLFLLRNKGYDPNDLEHLLFQRSGILGLSGVTGDIQEVSAEANKGNERCKQALRIYTHQIVKAIGGLVTVMGGLDLLVFSGDIGVGAPEIRSALCERLGVFGVEIEYFKNESARGDDVKAIAAESSKVPVYVIPVDEEVAIGQEGLELVLNLES